MDRFKVTGIVWYLSFYIKRYNVSSTDIDEHADIEFEQLVALKYENRQPYAATINGNKQVHGADVTLHAH